MRLVKRLKNLKHFLVAFIAVIRFGYPAKNLKVIGVTGTDGKTTTVHLIHAILEQTGKKSALISTVEAKIKKRLIDTGLHVTTPNPWLLQKLLRQMVDEGVEYVVIEATSHGLDQHRLLGCNFMVGVMTNVTHEHLDYHQTYQNYLKAKAKLFKGVKTAVLNKDDASYLYLKSKISIRKKIMTYGTKNDADLTPKTFSFKTKLLGEYNLYNCLAAIGAGQALNIKDETIKKAIKEFSGIPGRMEIIDEGQNFKVVVDFAHTPNSLEQVLKTLGKLQKETDQARIISVFGCAGERDVAKRPLMGKISTKLADITVLTTEDPRTEDVNEIIEQIARGIKRGETHFFRVSDRREAIKFAIQKLAKKGDIVIIFGKGHERSMCFGKIEYPWSDQQEARRALKILMM